MIYYIHSYSADAPLLHLCLKRLFELEPAAHAVVANDPCRPIPAHLLPKHPRVHVMPTPYPCGGNLNGKEMIEGMLDALIKIMEANKQQHIVKLDCDTWLNDVAWLQPGSMVPEGTPEPDYIGLERFEPFSAAGDCYRISIYAARAALRMLKASTFPEGVHLPEDRTIMQLVLRSRLPLLSIPYTQGRHAGLHDNLPEERHRTAWAVHCGETNTDGTRASRDFVLLRMRMLADFIYRKDLTHK